MNRRTMLGRLMGLRLVADAAVPAGHVRLERTPTMALSFTAPMCPVCGSAAMFTAALWDRPANALLAVECPSCKWVGHAPAGHRIEAGR